MTPPIETNLHRCYVPEPARDEIGDMFTTKRGVVRAAVVLVLSIVASYFHPEQFFGG